MKFAVRSAIGFLIAIAVCAVFAFVLVKKDVNPEKLPYFLIAAAAAGCFSGAFLASRKTVLKGIVSGLLSGAIVSLLFLLFTFFMNGLRFGMDMLWILAAGLLFGMIGGVTSKNVR